MDLDLYGFPNKIIVDQGSHFGDPFIRLADVDGINVDRTGIEAHNEFLSMTITTPRSDPPCEKYFWAHQESSSTLMSLWQARPWINLKDLHLIFYLGSLRVSIPEDLGRTQTTTERSKFFEIARS